MERMETNMLQVHNYFGSLMLTVIKIVNGEHCICRRLVLHAFSTIEIMLELNSMYIAFLRKIQNAHL